MPERTLHLLTTSASRTCSTGCECSDSCLWRASRQTNLEAAGDRDGYHQTCRCAHL